jgi:hypothetical protein
MGTLARRALAISAYVRVTDMRGLVMDIQVFKASDTWHKPPGAVTVEVIIKGGDGGWSIVGGDRIIPGSKGEVVYQEFAADQLPETTAIQIGEGGRGSTVGDLTVPGGRPGWAVVITHQED